MSCLCPRLKPAPPSDTLCSTPPGSSATSCVRPALLRARCKSSSEKWFPGSRLKRRLPENRVGSCGMIVSLALRSCRPMVVISLPSMGTLPLVGSIILNSARLRLDFPAPVLPTMPTFSLSETSKLKFSRTQGSSGRYLVAYPSNLISPVDGQCLANGTTDSQSEAAPRILSPFQEPHCQTQVLQPS